MPVFLLLVVLLVRNYWRSCMWLRVNRHKKFLEFDEVRLRDETTESLEGCSCFGVKKQRRVPKGEYTWKKKTSLQWNKVTKRSLVFNSWFESRLFSFTRCTKRLGSRVFCTLLTQSCLKRDTHTAHNLVYPVAWRWYCYSSTWCHHQLEPGHLSSKSS